MGYTCTIGKHTKIVETKVWRHKGSWPNTSTLPPVQDSTQTTTMDEWNSCEDEKCPTGTVRVEVNRIPGKSSFFDHEDQTSWTEIEIQPNNKPVKIYFIKKVITSYGTEWVDYVYACVTQKYLKEFEETLKKLAKWLPSPP